MSKKIKIGIVGGAGYTGGEMLRLLINHDDVDIRFVQSRSQAGKKVSDMHKDLTGDCHLNFVASLKNTDSTDILFLCLGHGESKVFLEVNEIPASTKIIDLSQDFRLGETTANRKFVYGLPELYGNEIKEAKNIANPGCFATAIQLGLLPLASEGILSEVHITGITGSTGAGQKLQDTSHFSWRNNNISAYKTLTHQHLKEVNRTLKNIQTTFDESVHFVPWRGGFTRGIFVSSVLKTDLSLNEVGYLYNTFYHNAVFTHVANSTIDLKQVVNTNKCLIYLEKEGENLVVHSVIDNLIKGASGQAIQNMNLMFGINETSGLKLKSIAH